MLVLSFPAEVLSAYTAGDRVGDLCEHGRLKLVGFFCQPDSGFQSHDPNQLAQSPDV